MTSNQRKQSTAPVGIETGVGVATAKVEPATANPLPPRTRATWIGFAVIAALFALIRLTAFGSLGEPITPPDSGVFTQLAQKSILSAEFYTGLKPFFLALLYKPFGAHLPTAVTLHALVGIIARTFLAYALFRSARTAAGGFISATLVLAYGCTRHVAHWDNVVLSESVSLSLLFSCLACLLLLAPLIASGTAVFHRKELVLPIGFALLTAGFIWIRDSNIYSIYLLMPLLVMAVVYLWKQGNRYWRVMAGVLCALLFSAILQGIMFRASHRWEFSMYNNIGQRVLTNQRMFDHFKSHGMPGGRDLMKHAGKWASDDNYAIYGVPGLGDWIKKSSPVALQSYLLKYPADTMIPMWSQLEANLRRNPDYMIQPRAQFDAFRNTPLSYMFNPSTSIVVFVPMLVLSVLGWNAWRRRDIIRGSIIVVCAWFFFHAVVQLLVNYHGDAMEVERHILGSVQSFRALLWISLGLVLDVAIGEPVENRARRAQVRQVRNTVPPPQPTA